MNKRFLIKLFCVLGFGLLVTNNTFAHTALSGSIPADGAMVMQAPENLQLSFTEEVRLLKAAVMMGEKEIEIEFKPSATAAKQFTVALPKLEHGHYTVAWSVMGADSHRVEGKLSFMIGMMGHQEGHGNTEDAAHDQHSGHNDQQQASHDH